MFFKKRWKKKRTLAILTDSIDSDTSIFSVTKKFILTQTLQSSLSKKPPKSYKNCFLSAISLYQTYMTTSGKMDPPNPLHPHPTDPAKPGVLETYDVEEEIPGEF